jgi:hypothetical protein
MRQQRWIGVLVLLVACGPGGGVTGPTLTLTPPRAAVAPGGSVAFTTAGSSGAVVWSATCGAVAGSGASAIYTAPAVEGACTVRASPAGGPAGDATAVVAVVSGEVAWRRQLGTPQDERARAVAASVGGSVMIVGGTSGSWFRPNLGLEDMFTLGFDAAGNVGSSQQLGTPAADRHRGVAFDGEDAVVSVGWTDGIADPGFGQRDGLVVKRVLRGGGTQWDPIALGTPAFDEAVAVAIDAERRVVVAGVTQGIFAVGGAQGLQDVFVVVIDEAGQEVWRRQFGSALNDWAEAVAVGPDGRIAVVGYTGGALAAPSAGDWDAFVVVLDADGEPLWQRQFGSAQADLALAAAFDPAGDLWVVGATNGALFGPLAGAYDAFALRFDPEGETRWSLQDGTAGFDAYLGVAIDPDGYVLLAGTTDAAWHGPHAGLTDAVAAKLDPAGGLVWAHQIGTPGLDDAYGIAVDGAGRSYLAGGTTGVIDGTHAGSYDVFLIGLRP